MNLGGKIMINNSKKAISFILTMLLTLGLVVVPEPSFAAVSRELIPSTVTITNNAGNENDVIYINAGLFSGDRIVVSQFTDITLANDPSKTVSTDVKSNSLRFEIPAETISDDPSGGEGTIYMSLIEQNKSESARVPVTYGPAPKSLKVVEANVVVTNKNDVDGKGSILYDMVEVTGLRGGDVFYVYAQDPNTLVNGERPAYIGKSSTVPSNKGSAQAFIRSMPETTSAALNTCYITVKSVGRTESDGVVIFYEKEEVTANNTITARGVNNHGATDKIMVSGAYSGDTVEVFQCEETTSSTSALIEQELTRSYGIGKVSSGKVDIEIVVRTKNGKALEDEGGWFMVKVTTSGKSALYSGPYRYEGEPGSEPINDIYTNSTNSNYIGPLTYEYDGSCVSTHGSVTIWNYENKLDKMIIRNVRPSDQIYIETNLTDPQETKQIKRIVVGTRATEVTATLKLPDIIDPATMGSITMYVISPGKIRSQSVVINFGLPEQTPALLDYTGSADPLNIPSTLPPSKGAFIAVTNGALKQKDEILVVGLDPGDRVYIYKSPTPEALERPMNTLSSGDVKSKKTSTIVTCEFPSTGSGVVYVARFIAGKKESPRTAVHYGNEVKSTVGGITFRLINTAGKDDQMIITSAKKDEVIKAYTNNDPKNYTNSYVTGSFTKVLRNYDPAHPLETETTTKIELPSLPHGATQGSIFITVTQPDLAESDLVEIFFELEPKSTFDPSHFQIEAINNYGPGDYIKFTQTADKQNPNPDITDTAIVANSIRMKSFFPGHTLATPKAEITLYTTTDPSIRVVIGKLILDGKNPSVTNNGVSFELERIVTSGKLPSAGGIIAYTVKYPERAESDRMEIVVSPEAISGVLNNGSSPEAIIWNNINTGSHPDYIDIPFSDKITIGSIVTVYNKLEANATILGVGKVLKATVKPSDTGIRITLVGKSLLNPNGDSVWISINEPNKAEGDRVEFVYGKDIEKKTPVPTTTKTAIDGTTSTTVAILAINNKGVDTKNNPNRDYIVVYGLLPGDVVRLYYELPRVSASAAPRITSLLVTVPSGQSHAAFSLHIPDDNWSDGGSTANAGYIQVTRPGMGPSEWTYLEEAAVAGLE